MKVIKVEKSDAQKVKKRLLKKNLFSFDYLVESGRKYVYFPVKDEIKGYVFANKKLRKARKQGGAKDSLKDILTKKEIEKINKAFDIVGDILLLDLDKSLVKKEKQIGDVLLKRFKNIKVVAKKVGIHKGKYRTQDYKVIAGEKRLETNYIESGVKIYLNVATCYNSPRLNNERIRIAKKIKKNENVLVMFSGVAPYPLIFSKYSKAKSIAGIEINPACHKYALKNIKVNKCNNIKLHKGDVKKIKLNEKFDRVVMPLPGSAIEFLDSALSCIKENGMIHMYAFVDENNFSKLEKNVKSDCRKLGWKATRLKIIKVGQYAPRKYRVCVDFKVSSYQ